MDFYYNRPRSIGSLTTCSVHSSCRKNPDDQIVVGNLSCPKPPKLWVCFSTIQIADVYCDIKKTDSVKALPLIALPRMAGKNLLCPLEAGFFPLMRRNHLASDFVRMFSTLKKVLTRISTINSLPSS